MADGVTGSVTIAPSDGIRHRGAAIGLGSPEFEASRTDLLAARRSGSAGLVHSWEMVTAVDGPGTRMTIFMSGCPLRCLYCHNPDTMGMKEGTVEKVEDVLKRIKRMQPVFKASNGGLTISGGEPLFQIEFTRRILAGAHEMGVHTCIDTSGYLGSRLTDEDLENIDMVLLDVKSGDEELYRRVTSRDLAPTIAFGDRLSALNKRVWVRFVLVPGLTDSDENVEKVAQIVSRWPNVERLEVLPFHNMGADKWHTLGMEYELDGVLPPTRESVHHVVDIFKAHGINAIAT
ncbi:pyruvate formate-lyase-activating protein [Corynebacterium uterequi]|uniref:Pyruvate formate-lyase-activating enzyme n=1 Tax=Corynebacterium uterequi TaxID=1072256 RepID=A0A0G3HG33_9CORY|nr:pyruvate formate-lyase-activating protein [Corynebacterium uterequi]AKK10913.1 pyruvate formate-lyase 1-activating enzyme [Corynebacterium uterequi]